LIYLNNAKVPQGNGTKIAVAVPIGGNLNVAKEILRGVAQAQDEINKSGGINGKLMQVAIANDDNNPAIAKQIANGFVKDTSILAVVGHNSSDASLTAAPEYQNGKLVMISPTSDAKNLSESAVCISYCPKYRFQPILSPVTPSKRVAKILCMRRFSSPSQSSLKDEFTSASLPTGGKVSQTNCDRFSPSFSMLLK
jgi:branched-chain amino acid transport system substrate-binding protein